MGVRGGQEHYFNISHAQGETINMPGYLKVWRTLTEWRTKITLRTTTEWRATTEWKANTKWQAFMERRIKEEWQTTAE